MAASFWDNLGDHFLNMGNAIVGVVEGAGQSLSATAQYNLSVADLNKATAANMSEQIKAQAEAEKQRNRTTMYIIALLFFLPALIVAAVLFIKTRG